MSAKVIAIAQAKGGVGKSTLCANLATTFGDVGDTLVIDCDPPQNSLLAWHKVREDIYEETGLTVMKADKPSELLNLLEKEEKNFSYILLDGPPHINPMTRTMTAVSGLVLIPMAPSPVEVWSFEQMDALIGESKSINPKAESRLCWTRVRKRVRSSEYLIEEVRKGSQVKPFACQLTQRVAYLDSFAEGLSVYEWPDTVARAEIWSLFSVVQRLLKKCPDNNLKKRKDIIQFSRS
ncbi:ParA family protein [Pleionea sediminis]|uniref:ParA family protein n=1 Tax=Pleionea sediminis TaxID=2569479 RepID=UPI0011866751|nr:ParA family protein [Pleionea sediminis]